MSVIPLTLTVSLCLVFTFVLFFLKEHSRRSFHSAESDALMPLAEETGRTIAAQPRHVRSTSCKGDHSCAGCVKRRAAAVGSHAAGCA